MDFRQTSEFTDPNSSHCAAPRLRARADLDTDRSNRTDVRRISANAQDAGRTVCRMTSPLPAAWIRRALPTRRRAIAAAAVVVLLAAAVTWAVWPQGPGVRTESGDASPSAPGRPATSRWTWTRPSTCPTTRRPAARCRRCCWRTGSAAPRSRVRADAEELRRARLRGAHLDRAGLRPQRRRDPPGQPGLRGPRRAAAAGLAGRPAGDPHRRRRRPAGRRGRRLVRRRAGAAARRARTSGSTRSSRMITWNDLSRAFLPESDRQDADRAACSRSGWAGLFFGGGGNAGSGRPGSRRPRPAAGRPGRPVRPARPGAVRAPVRGAPAVPATRRAAGSPPTSAPRTCEIATTGQADAGRRRPAAPVQPGRRCWTGSRRRPCWSRAQADSLFPLGEADANARGIAADRHPGAGRLVHRRPRRRQRPAVRRRTGCKFLTVQWLDHYVKGEGDGTRRRLHLLADRRLRRARPAAGRHRLPPRRLPGPGRRRPAGRSPVDRPGPADRQPAQRQPGRDLLAARSPVRLAVAARHGVAGDMPGQHADSTPTPLTETVDVVGAPTVQLRAASPTGEAVLFVKLYDVDPNGAADPAERAGRPGPADRPAGDHRRRRTPGHGDAAGDRPPVRGRAPAADHGGHLRPGVRHARPQPTVYTGRGRRRRGHACRPSPATPIATPRRRLALRARRPVAAHRGRARRGRRRGAAAGAGASRPLGRPEYAGRPLVVRGLRKEYADGFVAVSNGRLHRRSADRSSACSARTARARPPRCGC